MHAVMNRTVEINNTFVIRINAYQGFYENELQQLNITFEQRKVHGFHHAIDLMFLMLS